MTLRRAESFAENAAPIAPAAGPDSAVRTGKGSRALGRHQAAARLIDSDGGVGRHPAEPVFQRAEIAPQHRLKVGVQHGRGEPFVLAKLGLDLERRADRDVRQGGSNGSRDPVLVRGVAEREQQAYGARFGAARAHLAHHCGDGVVGEFGDRFAGRVHPFVDLESVAAFDERRRMILGERVHVRAGLPANLEQVAEASRRDHRDVAPAALDERIGADRRAVREPAQLPEVEGMAGCQLLQSLDDGAGRVVGRRRPLAGVHRAARLVEDVEVGERAAYVHSDPKSRSQFFMIIVIFHLFLSPIEDRKFRAK